MYCFRISSAIWPCCCIKDWTTGITKRTGEAEFWDFFSTSNAALDKVVMVEGITEVLSARAHQRRFSLVVPAGSKERVARRPLESRFPLTRSLSTEKHTLLFILCSGLD